MVDIVGFSTKSDRELLIVLASSFNSLCEQTKTLCEDMDRLQRIANSNKDKLQVHETQLIAVVKANADISEKTTDMLMAMHTLLNSHTEQLTNLEVVKRFFWWGVGIFGTLFTGTVLYLLNRWNQGGGKP